MAKTKNKNKIKEDVESVLTASISNRNLIIDFQQLNDYYDESLPLNKIKNGSGYIRPICKQTVLSVESYIVNQFLSADKISSSDDLNSLLSYKTLNNVITDGVKYGTGALQYNENIHEETVEYPGITTADLQQLDNDPSVTELKYKEVFDELGVVHVDATATYESVNPSIDHIDIANLFTDDISNNIQDNNFVAVREFVTEDEAKELGLKDDDLKQLVLKNEDEEYNTTDQVDTIDNEIDTYEIFKYQYNAGKETYTGIMSETKVLTCEQEPLKPFNIYTWNPIPRNNTIFGLGFIEASLSAQDLTTNLYRNILNNAGHSSFPQRIIDRNKFTVAEAEKLANPAAGQIITTKPGAMPQGSIEDIGVPFIAAQIYDIVKENEMNHFETYGIGQIVEQKALQNQSATTAAIQEQNSTQKLRNYCQQLYQMLSELSGSPDTNFGMSQDNTEQARAEELAGIYQLLQSVPNVDPVSIQNIVTEMCTLSNVNVNFVEPQPEGEDPLVALNREKLQLDREKIEMDGSIASAKIQLDKYKIDKGINIDQQQVQLKEDELQLKY